MALLDLKLPLIHGVEWRSLLLAADPVQGDDLQGFESHLFRNYDQQVL